MEKESKKSVTIVNKVVDHCDKYKNVYKTIAYIATTTAMVRGFSMSADVNNGVMQQSLVNLSRNTVNVIGNGHAGKVIELMKPNGTTQTFASINQACKELHISGRTLRRLLETGLPQETTGNMFKVLGAAQSPM